MTEESLDQKVEEFNSTLALDIPLERFDDVYREAMQEKQNSYDLSVTELNQAWHRIRESEFKITYYKCIGCKDRDEGRIDACPFHKR